MHGCEMHKKFHLEIYCKVQNWEMHVLNGWLGKEEYKEMC
jgi:hypothetical protein